MRTTHSGVIHVQAECKDCGWDSTARNALGNAAQHADKTGHEVMIEQAIVIVYNKKSG